MSRARSVTITLTHEEALIVRGAVAAQRTRYGDAARGYDERADAHDGGRTAAASVADRDIAEVLRAHIAEHTRIDAAIAKAMKAAGLA